MIRISDKFQENVVYFPKLSKFEKLHIILKDGLGNQIDLGDFTDEDVNPNFYTIKLDVKQLHDGEYTYHLNQIDSGIMQIGDLQPEITEFENEKGIIQYGE